LQNPIRGQTGTVPAENLPIVLTTHAIERMASRRIKEAQVISTVREPHAIAAGNTDFSRSMTREFPPGKRLTVIIEESDTEITVITTYWE
jgi:hypothetical protein